MTLLALAVPVTVKIPSATTTPAALRCCCVSARKIVSSNCPVASLRSIYAAWAPVAGNCSTCHDPNGLRAEHLWLCEAGDEGDQSRLAVRVGLVIDSPQLVARGCVRHAEAFGCGFEQLFAEQAVGEPRFRRGQAEDTREVGDHGSRARFKIREDDEALNEREALTDRVREPGGIGDNRAAVPPWQNDGRLKRLGAGPPDQVM